MGGHNYVPHRLQVHAPSAHTRAPGAHESPPQIHTLPFHNVIISFSTVSFFTKPRGVWGTVRVELTQARAAHSTASEGLLVPSAALPEETGTGRNGNNPDDPATQCGAGPFHTASASSCLTLLVITVYLEIRIGDWLFKRMLLLGRWVG